MGQDDAIPVEGDELEPLQLEGGDEPVAGAQTSSKIRAFGGAAGGRRTVKQEFKRPLNVNGTGATRIRVFRSKITVAAIDHMVNQINEWLDGGEIEVKHVTDVVGTLEGKTPEPNLIITVWY